MKSLSRRTAAPRTGTTPPTRLGAFSVGVFQCLLALRSTSEASAITRAGRSESAPGRSHLLMLTATEYVEPAHENVRTH